MLDLNTKEYQAESRCFLHALILVLNERGLTWSLITNTGRREDHFTAIQRPQKQADSHKMTQLLDNSRILQPDLEGTVNS